MDLLVLHPSSSTAICGLMECVVHVYGQPGTTPKDPFHSRRRTAVDLCPENSLALPHILFLVPNLKHFPTLTLFPLEATHPVPHTFVNCFTFPQDPLQLQGVKRDGGIGGLHAVHSPAQARKPCILRHKSLGIIACLLKKKKTPKSFSLTFFYSWSHKPRKRKWLPGDTW